MSDDLRKRYFDKYRINIHQPYEVRHWTQVFQKEFPELDITEIKLCLIIKKLRTNSVRKIRQYLKQQNIIKHLQEILELNLNIIE